MLRITENVESPQAVRLRLDGILTAETYEDFENIFFRHHTDDMKTIVLDMQGVTFLHEGAARKLARVRGGRVRVVNCSPFIATLLETVARQD
jgi:anti-anti-sigma regulatory factor